MFPLRILLLCLFSAAVASPQATPEQSPQASPAQSPPQPEIVSHDAPATFSSRINLVTVPVVVRDRDGRPVGSLRQEDFQLFDKGKAQVISRFSIETSGSAAAKSPESPAPAQAAPSPAQPAEPPKPVLPSRYVAYLFDDVHSKVGDLLQGRQAANRQVDRTLDPNTRVGIFTTSGRTTQDFTGDAGKLHAAINRIQPWERGLDNQTDCPTISYYLADLLINQSQSLSPGLSDAQVMSRIGVDQLLNAVIQEAEACLQTTNLQQVLPQVRTAAQLALSVGKTETFSGLSVLLDLVRSMSSLPGNRSIVMVSPGFLLATEQRVFENDIFEKAIHANVTINTLDVRGVATIPGMDASQRGYQGASAGALMQADITAASLAQDLLGELAAGTGGTFFHNDNALADGLQELAARPEYVYVLGFSPDNLKFDGSYHGLKVTLKNGAGVNTANLKIAARRGYWAPNHSISPAEEAKEEIEDAVFSREERLDIPVKLHTEFFKQSQAKAELTVETRVDLKGLKFRKADDRNRDTLTVVTGLFDQNGRYMKGTERTMEMQLRDQTLDAGKSTGLVVKESFEVPPGRYVVRVVVRDTEGRSMAAQNEGVEIP
jgi:VWFA-related protein